MSTNSNRNTIPRFAAIILSYIAIVALVLIVLHKRSPRWQLFIDRSMGLSALTYVLITAFGMLLYLKRAVILSFLKTDLFRYSAILAVAAAGIFMKIHAVEFIIILYAVYALLFINRSPNKITNIYYSVRTLVDRLFAALFSIEGRTPALFALVLLLAVPLLLILKKTSIAEQVAVYVYYFLVLTVVIQIMEMKLNIKRENLLLSDLKTTWVSFKGILSSVDWRSGLPSFFRKFGRRLFTQKNIVYLGVLLVVLASTYAVKHRYWKNIERGMDGNAEYRSEISLTNNGTGDYTFPSYTDELIVPIRIKHPVNQPLLWQNSGEHSVSIGIQWFRENNAGRIEEKVFEDSQVLPRPLFVSESADIQLNLKRPPIPTGRAYEVRIGLVSDGKWWFLSKGDGVQKISVYAEELSHVKSFAHENRRHDYLQRRMEDEWSRQLSSSGNAYHSTIEVLKNNLYSSNKITLVVRNTGNIPWPVKNQDPVRIGVVWLQKIDEDGHTRYIHVSEGKYSLPEVVYPGERDFLEISFDPFRSPDADEIWIGMVHDGKTWFYKQGDPVYKLIQQVDKYKLLAQQSAIVRKKDVLLETELNKRLTAGSFKESTKINDADYRSKMQLLNYKTSDLIVSGSNGLVLELLMTNTGKIPWQPANEKPVNLGVLWFKKSADKLDYSKRVGEERCHFPFTVLENIEVRVQCKIGAEVKSGNYEVWIGPVQENVAWFYQKGDSVLKLNVAVE